MIGYSPELYPTPREREYLEKNLRMLISGLNKVLNGSNIAKSNNTEKSGYLIEVSGFHCYSLL